MRILRITYFFKLLINNEYICNFLFDLTIMLTIANIFSKVIKPFN